MPDISAKRYARLAWRPSMWNTAAGQGGRRMAGHVCRHSLRLPVRAAGVGEVSACAKPVGGDGTFGGRATGAVFSGTRELAAARDSAGWRSRPGKSIFAALEQ